MAGDLQVFALAQVHLLTISFSRAANYIHISLCLKVHAGRTGRADWWQGGLHWPLPRGTIQSCLTEHTILGVSSTQAAPVSATVSAAAGEQSGQPAAAPWPGAKLVPLAASVAIGAALRFAVPVPAGVTLQAWTLLAIFVSTIAGAQAMRKRNSVLWGLAQHACLDRMGLARSRDRRTTQIAFDMHVWLHA